MVKPVNYVFLLTDGAVAAEREICSYVQNEMKDIRLMTFGIGPYCNPQFLRVLGILGRGFTDLSLHQELIYDQMVHMLDKASMPILTNVRMFASANPKQNNFPGLKSLYPGGLPDLYGGSPIQITGTFTGTLPPLSVRRNAQVHHPNVGERRAGVGGIEDNLKTSLTGRKITGADEDGGC